MVSALALVGLLTQLGVPAYTAISRDLQQAATARDLAQTLRSARSHALLHDQVVLVRPLEGGWRHGWRTLLEPGGQVLREQRMTGRTNIVGNMAEVRFSEQGVPFRGNGAFLGGALHVCAQRSAESRDWVVLSPSGRVSLRTDTVSQPQCAGA